MYLRRLLGNISFYIEVTRERGSSYFQLARNRIELIENFWKGGSGGGRVKSDPFTVANK